MGNPHDAEAAAQDCFIALAHKAHTVRTSVGAWLHRRATHLCLDLLKQSRARARRERQRAAAKAADDADAAEWPELAPEVDRALDALPDRLRYVLVWHLLRRRSQAELMAELRVSPATVSRRVQRGVEIPRRKLGRAGVTVPGVALTGLLAEKTTSAAPAALTEALGKMAMAGFGPAPKKTLTHICRELVMLAERNWVVSIAIVAAAVIGATVYTRTGNPVGADEPKVIQAQQVVLVDAQARPRIVVGVEGDAGGIRILDQRGKVRLTLWMVDETGIGMNFSNEEGVEQIKMGVDRGGPGFALHDQNGTERLMMAFAGVNGGMSISDSESNERIAMGGGVQGVGISLKDMQGLKQLGIGIGPGGGGDFVAKDSMGNDLWRALGEVGPAQLP